MPEAESVFVGKTLQNTSYGNTFERKHPVKKHIEPTHKQREEKPVMEVVCFTSKVYAKIRQKLQVAQSQTRHLVLFLFRMGKHQEEVIPDYKKDGKNKKRLHKKKTIIKS